MRVDCLNKTCERGAHLWVKVVHVAVVDGMSLSLTRCRVVVVAVVVIAVHTSHYSDAAHKATKRGRLRDEIARDDARAQTYTHIHTHTHLFVLTLYCEYVPAGALHSTGTRIDVGVIVVIIVAWVGEHTHSIALAALRA